MARYAVTESLSDLLQQPIRERSVNAMVLCPFHDERTPSFSVHLEEGVWHCFGCGKQGSLERLYHELDERMDDGLYLQRAARRATDFGDDSTRDYSPIANALIEGRSVERGRLLIESYLRARPINGLAPEHYALGYDEGRDALSFPYWDSEGRVTGIKFRHRDGRKSSLDGSQYGLYGVSDVLGKGTVLVCEGESDTQSTWSAFLDIPDYGVCGTSGASISEAQWTRFGLHLMFARRIYLLYDADEAGDRCADTAMRVLGDDKCVRVRPTKGKDISEHLLAGGNFGELGI